MIDNFYVIVHTRTRRVILKEIIRSRGAKDRLEQINLIQTETAQSGRYDQSNQRGL